MDQGPGIGCRCARASGRSCTTLVLIRITLRHHRHSSPADSGLRLRARRSGVLHLTLVCGRTTLGYLVSAFLRFRRSQDSRHHPAVTPMGQPQFHQRIRIPIAAYNVIACTIQPFCAIKTRRSYRHATSQDQTVWRRQAQVSSARRLSCVRTPGMYHPLTFYQRVWTAPEERALHHDRGSPGLDRSGRSVCIWSGVASHPYSDPHPHHKPPYQPCPAHSPPKPSRP